MTHTPGIWLPAKNGGGVISTNTDGKLVGGADEVHYYGGFLICESVAKQNIPIIAAAPMMLALLKAISAEVEGLPETLKKRIETAILVAEPEEKKS